MADFRKIRTQKAINDAFSALLKEIPFEKITVTMIVQKALINRNRFYLHYLDKYDLLNKWLREKIIVSNINLTEITERPFSNLKKWINNTNSIFVQAQKDDAEFRRAFLEVVISIFTESYGDIDEFWFSMGKFKAIVEWNRYHDEVIKDFDELQEIYDTEKFPKIKKVN